ncbi:histidinol dehydrogenase [Lutibacter sp.]
MKKIINPDRKEWTAILKRPTTISESIEETVASIFADINRNGEEGLKRYTEIFDGAAIDDVLVSETTIAQAEEQLPEALKEAIAVAKENIDAFHSAQKVTKKVIETTNGVFCWQEKRPIQKVGLYIPGGTAPLFSTVLMLAIPAKIAGCSEIILCTPPDKQGNVNPAILYAAQLCGVSKIVKAGGIQAIAALTFGTETVPAVYKIFGPGNQYVTTAKQYATKFGVAIDMPAGPSELLIIADDSSNAAFVASDLLSQAEHGEDSQVLLISTSEKVLNEVEKELALQLEKLPRKKIAQKSIANSKLICVKTDDEALELINEYAPEHLIVCTKNTDFYCNGIVNAGSVFIGNYSPESAGDYASGTNHTLPTNGFAKAYSGVNLDSFLKTISFQEITVNGIQNIGNAIEIMAQEEGLYAHKNAVTLRLKSLK